MTRTLAARVVLLHLHIGGNDVGVLNVLPHLLRLVVAVLDPRNLVRLGEHVLLQQLVHPLGVRIRARLGRVRNLCKLGFVRGGPSAAEKPAMLLRRDGFGLAGDDMQERRRHHDCGRTD